jgi:photosystem II stability/assembly factor-like uncharacterized protein
MKKITLLVSISYVIFSCHKTNTNPIAPIARDTLNAWVKSPKIFNGFDDIWFADPGNGIVVGDSGLLSSNNGGKTWNIIPNTLSISGFNIQFLDNQNGFVQGLGLWATTDGGKTWTYRSQLIQAAISFQFITTTDGFYFAENSGINKTIDGGNKWTPILAPTTPGFQLYPFYFLDSLRGFTMMDGNFSQTVDGGAHWQLVSNVTNLPYKSFCKMQFLDTLNGYCGAPDGLLKTVDGGKTWLNCLSSITRPTAPSLNLIVPTFFDVNNGYCMTSNAIFKTTNGGKDWTISCKLVTYSFSGTHFLDMNTGWACTFDGYVLSLKL